MIKRLGQNTHIVVSKDLFLNWELSLEAKGLLAIILCCEPCTIAKISEYVSVEEFGGYLQELSLQGYITLQEEV